MLNLRAIFVRSVMASSYKLVLPALFAAVLLAGCGKQEVDTSRAGSRTVAPASQPFSTWFPLGVGEKTIQVQLALSPAEQAQGLMGRKSLDTDHGMLFVFERGKRQSFWMANTPLPLDIGYFDNDGVLREVYPLYPFDRSSVVSQRSDIRYALEMAQGWFAANGVRPGARINQQMLEAALRQRQ